MSFAAPIQMAVHVTGKELALPSIFGREFLRLTLRVGQSTVTVVGD